MDILRSIVVLIHIIGFAMLFGAWIVEVFNGRRQIVKVMHWGLVVALVAGLALAAPWGVEGEMNYMKIGIKLVVVVIVGALLGIGAGRQKRTGHAPAPIFWLVGLLTLLNAGLAVIW